MSVDTFLNFISVIIAAIDIGIVIYDRLNANNQSYIISKVEAPTVNIFIQTNPTTNGPTFQTSREYSEGTQRDYSQYAKFFFVFILILGFALQTHFRVFIILLSISTILSLIGTKSFLRKIHVPLLGAKRVIWFLSPSITLISSLAVNSLLEYVTFPAFFGNMTKLLLSCLVCGLLGVAFLLLFIQQFFALLVPHLHSSNTISNYIKVFTSAIFKAWWLPAICATFATVSLLPNILFI